MTDPKQPTTGEDLDWADALDEWEQKAFGSIHPPPAAPSAPPPPQDAQPAGDDRTLASAEPALPVAPASAPPPAVEVVTPMPDGEARVSVREVDLDEVEVEDEPAGSTQRSATPPPLPVALASAVDRIAPRIDALPASGPDARPSVVTGALRAIASIDGASSRPSAIPAASRRPVSADIADVLAEQAAWLEAEARTLTGTQRARVLLAESEIRAVLGADDRAILLAEAARDAGPDLALTHRQVRGLRRRAGAPGMDDPAALLGEQASASPPLARQHAAVLAAEALRLAGDPDGARKVLTGPVARGDIRAIVALAASGLAENDLDGLLALVGRSDAAAVAEGVTTALRLRGRPIGAPRLDASPEGVTDALRASRLALDAADAVAAAGHVARLRAVPELANGASWLAASLAGTHPDGRPRAGEWLGELAREGDPLASRALAAYAVEGNDPPLAVRALSFGGFSDADVLALGALLELGADPNVGADDAPLAPLVAAVRAQTPGRATQVEPATVGASHASVATSVARLLASGAPSERLEASLETLRAAAPDTAAALDLELALRGGDHARVSDILRRWGASGGEHATDSVLVAALVAERAGDTARALAAYREVRSADRSSELALRCIASLHAATDLPGELNDLADELGATVRGSLVRLEAVVREDSVDDATRAELLERAHRAASALPVAAYLAERLAVRGGNVDDSLRWLEERRGATTDPVEQVVALVREARLVASTDPARSARALAEAHQLRPSDLALRELYERAAGGVVDDHAQFWEAEALATSGDTRALLSLDAVRAYERSGDAAAALRAAAAASAGDDLALVRVARERAEVDAGEAAQLVDQLLGEAKGTPEPIVQREAYERLADIDGVGRGDPASALLWHKTILEDDPTYLPSLRYVEHALIREGRDDELEPVAVGLVWGLTSSEGSDGGERVAHADLAARLRARGPDGEWDATYEVAALAAADPTPSLSSLRLVHAHARVRKDDELLIDASKKLLDRATRPVEMAALRLRLAEAAFRQSDLATALTSLERSATEDPGDIVAFRLLAEVRSASGDPVGAAEAHEAVARLSLVPGHQLDAWYDAARLWLSDGAHDDEAVQAFEQAAAIDLSHEDVFARLSALYAARGAHIDLASLLERRIAAATDVDERVTLEVERGRALLASGDRAGARTAVAAALAERPDHTTALATFGELSALDEDWPAAEDAWVRLARLLAAPDEQRAIYERLGNLYSTKAVHLERAELAFKEVLKRAPGDVPTLERLVDVHRRQRDVTRAVEVQQELIAGARTPAEKRDRTIELAAIHEDPGHDERKAEQILEAARREQPTDVTLLRALAEFYARHKQTPAMNILLDRAAADARRAFAAGRFAPALFEVMRTVFDLRGKPDAATIVGASLLAIEGRPAAVRGAYGPALDARLDDLLAPDVLSPGLRSLLAKAGAMLDVASPIDLRAMGAQPAGPEARLVTDLAASFASGLGLQAPKVFVSRTIGRTCLPAASDPPALVIGESLLSSTNEQAVAFLVMRAMKLVAARASALVRSTSTDLAVLVPAWLQALVPSWAPQGVNPTALAAAARKVALATAPAMSDELVSLGLEVGSHLGTRASTLGALALAWANRAALLGVGDPNSALEALAWSLGNKDGAPADPLARAAWIGRTHEAKDLLIFSVGDGYSEARARLGLDG